MGVHLAASGKGLRQLEAEGVITGWEGSEGFASTIRKAGGEASRVDYALDDHSGKITPDMVDQAVNEGRCVSRFKRASPREDVHLVDGSRGGWSMYFGAASSRLRCRFYDKAAEQSEKGCAVDGPWMRFEVQARDARAELVLKLLEEGQRVSGFQLTPAQALAGLLWSYVDFKDAGNDTNRCRWKTCSWWSELLQVDDKVRAGVATVHKTVEELAAWFQRQVTATYTVLLLAKDYGQEWFEELVTRAVAPHSRRLKERHWNLLGLSTRAQCQAVT